MKKFYHKDRIEVGIDEVARGCLAGPVFSAAVIWPHEIDEEYRHMEDMIKDSKKLSRKRRAVLREFIENFSLDYSVAYVDAEEIDKVNILNATHNAMHKAISNLNIVPDHLLIDGNSFKPYYHNDELIDNTCVIEGDKTYISIAAASILAKEYHDDYIKELCKNDEKLNRYDWCNNMCYGTKKHLDAIKEYGITKYHRKTFGINKNY